MIGDGNLPCSHNLVNQNQVIHHASHEGTDRNLVGACINIRGNSLLLKTSGLGNQVCHGSRGPVCSEASHNSGHSPLHGICEHQLRRSCMVTALSAAPQDMHMGVNQPGHQNFPRAVDHCEPIGLLFRKVFRNP